MLARPFARWCARRGIHYAWVVMAVVFLTMLISAAALGLPGVFIPPLSHEFGWSTSQISAAIAVRFLLYGLLGPFAAILIERFGLRRVVCCALLLVALGLLLATRMGALWQLIALWGVALGAGSGLIALVLGATIANRWFEQRRGLALGLLTASSATGQLLFLRPVASLIQHHGWRVAVMPVVSGCFAIALLAFLLLRDRPQDLGLRPFGADPRVPETPLPIWRPGFAEPLRVLRSVSGSATFWVLFGTFFVCGLSTSGLIQTHLVSLCGDYGMGPIPAASVLTMIGFFDFFGTIASGWLSDRFDNRKLLFWYYGLRGVSLLWLPHSDFTLYGLALFAIFYGLDWVATVPPTVKLTSAAFDRARSAMIFGWIFAGHQLGGAAASYGAGLTRTMLLTYSPAIYAAGVACLLAAVAILLLQHTGHRAAPAATTPATARG
jgi:MFS family permease